MPKLIALLTDFDTRDWFVAEMKAVIAAIAPQTTTIDISHAVKHGNTGSAAFMLLAAYKTFPAQTVFCVAVDSSSTVHADIIIQCDDYFFVSSDNGVVSWVTNDNHVRIWRIENSGYFRIPHPSTFRGRDVLAPVAAHLSSGTAPDQFGPQTSEFFTIPFPCSAVSPHGNIRGEIIYIDSFGNAITTIESKHLQKRRSPSTIRIVKSGLEMPVKSNYYEVCTSKELAYAGSAGFIEIGVNEGNAAAVLNLAIGDKVELLYYNYSGNEILPK